MNDSNKTTNFANNLEAIMGANQDMLTDLLSDLFEVMPVADAEAMKRTLLSIHSEYETDMSNLIKQTRADAKRFGETDGGGE